MRWFKTLKDEWFRLRHDRDAMLAMFAGILLYSLIYPQPYANQSSIEQPIAVVDLDQSSVSRRVIRALDASPDIEVVQRHFSYMEAHEALLDQQVRGVLVLPEDLQRQITLGRQISLNYEADASYFLVYANIASAITRVVTTSAVTLKVILAAARGDASTAHTWWPWDMELMPLFNTTGGYANYVIPGVFLLILQQTLLLGSALLARSRKVDREQGNLTQLLTRGALLCVLYLLPAHYYYGWIPNTFNFAYQLNYWQWLPVMMLYLFSVVMAGTVIGFLCKKRHQTSQVILISSMLMLFISGYIWPMESVPGPIQYLSQILPSTQGINALVQLVQQGASVPQIMPELWKLSGLVVLYGGLALWLMRRDKVKQP